jgi:hypothetical protein
MRSVARFVGLVAGLLAIAVTGILAVAAMAWMVLGTGSDPGIAGRGDVPIGASTPLGTSSDDVAFTVWDRNDDGSPVRWDPCSSIDLVVADALAPEGWRQDLDSAIATLRQATGLDLRIINEVDEPPSDDRSPYQPDRYGDRWAPILVAWAMPTDDPWLRDVDRGLGIPVAVGTDDERVYVSGHVVLNADRPDLQVGTADRRTSWAATVLHELIHVLGLGHVDDASQLMATFPGAGPVRLGTGDLAGLAAVSADQGCLDVPDPQPVEIAPASRRDSSSQP